MRLPCVQRGGRIFFVVIEPAMGVQACRKAAPRRGLSANDGAAAVGHSPKGKKMSAIAGLCTCLLAYKKLILN